MFDIWKINKKYEKGDLVYGFIENKTEWFMCIKKHISNEQNLNNWNYW